MKRFDGGLNLSLKKTDELFKVARALSSPARLDVLKLLGDSTMICVSDIARILHMPLSTVAVAVRELEEAGLITTEVRSGKHGATKQCWLSVNNVKIELRDTQSMKESKSLALRLPVGGYSCAESIAAPCGMLGEFGGVDSKDDPSIFYQTERLNAQMLWFTSGFLEYRFYHPKLRDEKVVWLELTFEACSEAPLAQTPWESDISVLINDQLVGVWTSPCDCGGRHDIITHEWWMDYNVQFGFVKKWRIDATGSYLDQKLVSSVCLDDLNLLQKDYISVRIGVAPDAAHVGGINLFGKKMVDNDQNVMLRIGLS